MLNLSHNCFLIEGTNVAYIENPNNQKRIFH